MHMGVPRAPRIEPCNQSYHRHGPWSVMDIVATSKYLCKSKDQAASRNSEISSTETFGSY